MVFFMEDYQVYLCTEFCETAQWSAATQVQELPPSAHPLKIALNKRFSHWANINIQ